MQSNKTCGVCGRVLQPGESFCTFCGSQVNSEEQGSTYGDHSAPCCSFCGSPLMNNAKFCTSCGRSTGSSGDEKATFYQGNQGYQGYQGNCNPIPTPPYLEMPPTRIRHHLVLSILCTLFCCQLLGIVALIFSILSITDKKRGDYQSAIKNGKIAYWIDLSIIILFVIGVLITVTFSAFSASSGY